MRFLLSFLVIAVAFIGLWWLLGMYESRVPSLPDTLLLQETADSTPANSQTKVKNEVKAEVPTEIQAETQISQQTAKPENQPPTTRSQSFCEMANAIGVTMSCPLDAAVESQKREALYKLYNGLSKANVQALQAELTSLQQAAEATFKSRQQEIAGWQEEQYALEDIQRKKEELEKEKNRLQLEMYSAVGNNDEIRRLRQRSQEISKQLKSLENLLTLHATWTATLQAWRYRDTVDFNRTDTWQQLNDWLAAQKTDYRQDEQLLAKALENGGWSAVDVAAFTQETDRQVLMAMNKILALPGDQLAFAPLKNLLTEATK